MPRKRNMTGHWVDRLCEETGKPINQLAKDSGISTGWFSNCKRRGTPINRVVSDNKKKLAKVVGCTDDELDILYKD